MLYTKTGSLYKRTMNATYKTRSYWASPTATIACNLQPNSQAWQWFWWQSAYDPFTIYTTDTTADTSDKIVIDWEVYIVDVVKDWDGIMGHHKTLLCNRSQWT